MTAPWSIRPESRSRGGGSRRGRALSGYARIWANGAGFSVAWRWKTDARWHEGSVATREEAEDLRLTIRDCLARGEDPGELPTLDVRDAAPPPVTAGELAERRARLAKQLAPDAERCPRCHVLKPCEPCITEVRRELRSARRGDP